MSNLVDRNPLGLEVGKEYWLKYMPAPGCQWERIKITRLNPDGIPWGEGVRKNGIINGEYYTKKDIMHESELIGVAIEFLNKKDLGWLVGHSDFTEVLIEFHKSLGPNYQ